MPKSTSAAHANSLKRNQACHQCRKRKLKCDAKKPCSTCARSHAYAVAHAPPGAHLPPHPDCTFDAIVTVPEVNIPISEHYDSPKDRFERLESRINQLETLLQEKERNSHSPNTPPGGSASTSTSDSSMAGVSPDPGMLGGGSSALDGVLTFDPFDGISTLQSDADLGFSQFQPDSFGTPGVAGLMDITLSGLTAPLGHTSPPNTAFGAQHLRATSNTEILPYGWPRNLPEPRLVRHLVEALFAFDIDAPRLFHGPSFLASLSLAPTHPDFPHTGVLHAMCAVGSLYTALVDPHPTGLANGIDADEVFDGKVRQSEKRPDSFAETQAKFAHQACMDAAIAGHNLFGTLQALVLLTGWYWWTAKWTQCYITCALALRSCGPLGLNTSPPFGSIEYRPKGSALLPTATNVIEAELRRNALWIAYGMERMIGSGHGWALMVDDQDISQLMPVRADKYEQGTYVPADKRQWSHDHDVLLRHPEDQTDAFVLRVKSTILLSRVKNFNLRFRARYYAGDPSIIEAYRTPQGVASLGSRDMRQTPAFMALDQLVSAFLPSFPAHLRDPVHDQTVNPHLFTACTAPHLAMIILHESLAMVGEPHCTSSCKILHAARQILNLVYSVCSTSFDLLYLGQFALLCWFMSGRVLIRFLRAAIDSNSEQQIVQLRLEIQFLRTVVAQLSERSPLAFRYNKLIREGLVESCGEQYVDPLPFTLPPRWPGPEAEFDDQSQAILSELLMRDPPDM